MINYSVSSRESLQSCGKWLTCKHNFMFLSYYCADLIFLMAAVKAALSKGPSPIGVLVGCKSDLRDGTLDSRAEVSQQEGRYMASSLGMGFFETSAATNHGVEDPFRYIAEEFLKRSVADSSPISVA